MKFLIKDSLGSVIDEITADTEEEALAMYANKAELLMSDIARLNITAENKKIEDAMYWSFIYGTN